MGHVVTVPPAARRLAEGAFLRAVPAGRDNVIWILQRDGGALVVDGPSAAPAREALRAQGLRWEGILLTHTHQDHIGLLADLTPGELSQLRIIGPASRSSELPQLTEPVAEGDRVSFQGLTLQVWETPGHLDGHLSYLAPGAVFCGDTLFAGGCGYLFDGPPEAMYRSLVRLASLPDDTLVCCAHEYTLDNLHFAWTVDSGNVVLAERIRQVRAARARGETVLPSTIGMERATNPFLRCHLPDLAVAAGVADRAGLEDLPTEVFRRLRRAKDARCYQALPLTAFP